MADDAGAAAAAAAAAAAGVWHKDVAPEFVGHWQNRGLDLTKPDTIAVEMTKAHREAEKLIGAPANEMIRIPKVGDEVGLKAMWQRLGTPADAKDYDFPVLKGTDGKVVDEALDTSLRSVFAKANVPKDAAAQIAADVVKHFNGVKDAAAADRTAKLAEEKVALAKNWGANVEANKLVASRAAAALGVKPEAIAALEGVIGYAAVMEMMRNIGTKIGEARFIGGDQQQPGILSRDQAVAKKAELMADTAWVARYQKGGDKSAEFREMMALNTILSG